MVADFELAAGRKPSSGRCAFIAVKEAKVRRSILPRKRKDRYRERRKNNGPDRYFFITAVALKDGNNIYYCQLVRQRGLRHQVDGMNSRKNGAEDPIKAKWLLEGAIW